MRMSVGDDQALQLQWRTETGAKLLKTYRISLFPTRKWLSSTWQAPPAAFRTLSVVSAHRSPSESAHRRATNRRTESSSRVAASRPEKGCEKQQMMSENVTNKYVVEATMVEHTVSLALSAFEADFSELSWLSKDATTPANRLFSSSRLDSELYIRRWKTKCKSRRCWGIRPPKR